MKKKEFVKTVIVYTLIFLSGFLVRHMLLIYNQNIQILDLCNILLKMIIKLSNPIMAVASVLNLIIIVFFYANDKKARKVEQNINREGFWYRTIIIEKNINLIDEYYKSSLNTLEDVNKIINSDKVFGNELIKIINDFKKSKTNLLVSLNDLIRILNEELAKDLDQLVLDFEDEFIEYLIDFIYSNGEKRNIFGKMLRKCNDFRLSYLSKVYSFDLNCYEYNEDSKM